MTDIYDRTNPEPLVGELISNKPRLFKIRESNGLTSYIALEHVAGVVVEPGSDIINIKIGDLVGSIDHPEDIARFWEQWEIV